MTIEMRRVELPKDLCDAAERKFKRQFTSVDDLIIFILKDALRDDSSRLDQVEQNIIEERLRELGYL